jgi:hypothetical protein
LAKECFYKAAKFDGKNPQNYGAHLHLALMLMRESGIDPKQISQELQTYADSYAQWGAERQMRDAFYPPNLASLQDYMRLYGGDPDWQPRPPNTDRLEQFRRVLGFVAAEPEAAEQHPVVGAAPEQQPVKPEANAAKKVEAAASAASVIPAVMPPKKK